MAEVEVLSSGVISLERVLDLTRVPEDMTVLRLQQQEKRVGAEEALTRIRQDIGRFSRLAAEQHERLAMTSPIRFSAELIAVHGIHSELFRIYEERRYKTGNVARYDRTTGQWEPMPRRTAKRSEPTGYLDPYELLRVTREEALTAVSMARGSFWQREKARLQEALAVLDARVRGGWEHDLDERPGWQRQLIEQHGLDVKTILFIDPTYCPFRIDPRSRQNNGVRYVKPGKKHPRPLDLVWQLRYKTGTEPEPIQADESGEIYLLGPKPKGTASQPQQPIHSDQGTIF